MQESRIWDQPAVIKPVQVLTPRTSKEASPTYTPSYNPQAGFTCGNCANRIYDPNPDYVKVKKTVLIGKSDFKSIALHLPSRCKKCDGEYRRYKRMQVRTRKIWDFTTSLAKKKYKLPKLITFNLTSGASANALPESEIKLLKKKMRQAKKILEEAGTLGGTYVIEATTRLYGFRENEDWVKANAWGCFSHHAHCHMVAVAPYVEQSELPEKINHILNPIGLGNINYLAVKHRKEVASYITKYLTKGKTRSVTWGIMRRTKK